MPRASEEFTCKTSEDLFNLAKNFTSRYLNYPITVLLSGLLGAGKTHFVKGALSAFNINSDDISSPTFSLVNIYETPSLSVAHFDLYRLGSLDEFSLIGGLDLLSSHLCFIEWPNIVKEEISKPFYDIEIMIEDSGNRLVKITKVEE